MNGTQTDLQASFKVDLDVKEVFDTFAEELRLAFLPEIIFEPGVHGRLTTTGDLEIGTVIAWQPGAQISLRWHQADWKPEEITQVRILFEKIPKGTRVTVVHEGWGRLIDNEKELTGWFAGQIAASLLRATAPKAFGDWLTDRKARRPSGALSRGVYRDPLFHYPNFLVLLEELALTPRDYLIEIGCGGGAFLKEALESGCRAAAVDHSPDMVQLARSENRAALDEGRLEIRQASAERLPFADGTFSCAVMTGVLGFLPDPVAAFREIRRVLAKEGRFVGLGSDSELRGTPAAPEPIASRLRFYGEKELKQLAVQAGFEQVRVVRRDLKPYARKAGIPQASIPLFSGAGAHFLIARRG
jgi:SAM-dependent methyltransferase